MLIAVSALREFSSEKPPSLKACELAVSSKAGLVCHVETSVCYGALEDSYDLILALILEDIFTRQRCALCIFCRIALGCCSCFAHALLGDSDKLAAVTRVSRVMREAVIDGGIHGVKTCGKCPGCFLYELVRILLLGFCRKTSFEENDKVSVIDPCDHVGRICRFTETVGHVLDEEVHRLVADSSRDVIEAV